MTLDSRLPYPGLRSYQRDESDLFFGREGCIDDMVQRLANTRFLSVLGASGSGKSSLVRTGLLDALELGYHSSVGSRWMIIDCHPGGQPTRNLAHGLLQETGKENFDDTDVSLLENFLKRGPLSVADWCRDGHLPKDTNLLLLVDQFEELFRYGNYADREEAEAFSSLLLESARSDVSIHVVITMRSEYLGACALMPGLAEQINEGLYLTRRMTREECREAIEGPAGVTGFTIEPALVNRLLNDLSSFAPWDAGEKSSQLEQLSQRADQLPIMQHVLSRLWQRALRSPNENGVILKLANYESVGELPGAFEAHALEVIERLSAPAKEIVKDVFRALVTGTSISDAVRKPEKLGDLAAIVDADNAVIKEVVDAFRAPDCNFLRPSYPDQISSDTFIDISHESLIRQWPSLADWLAEETRATTLWQRLATAQTNYERGNGELLSGLDLANVVDWWDKEAPTSAWVNNLGGDHRAVSDFVIKSKQFEQERQKEKDSADKIERKKLRIRAAVYGGLAILAGLTSGLAFYANNKVELVNDQLQAAVESERASAMAASLAATVAEDQAKLARQAEATAVEERDRADRQRDEAEVAKAKAESAEIKAIESEVMAREESARAEKNLAAARSIVNDTVDIFSAEEVKSNVSISPFVRKLFTLYKPQLEEFSAQSRTSGAKVDYARAQLRMTIADEEAGGGVDVLNGFKDAFDSALEHVSTIETEKHQEQSLTTFYEAAFIYIWKLYDFGQISEARRVVNQVESVRPFLEIDETNEANLYALARYLNAYSRSLSQKQMYDESLAAQLEVERLARIAVLLSDNSPVGFRLLSSSLTNQAKDLDNLNRRDESDIREKEGCAIKATLAEQYPLNVYVVESHANCLETESYSAADKLEKLRLLDDAISALDFILKVNADSATIRVRLLDILQTKHQVLSGDKEAQRSIAWLFEEQLHMLFADKAIVPTYVNDLQYAVEDILKTEFTNPEDSEKFYRGIYNSVRQSADSFPEIPALTFAAGLSAMKLAKLFEKDELRRPEAYPLIEDSNKYLDLTGFISDTSKYSERFTAVCESYAVRAKLAYYDKKTDEYIRKFDDFLGRCKSILDKYPFDFYLRQHFEAGYKQAGELLFGERRYGEALPHLKHSSEQGNRNSTRILVQMYEAGLGVKQDQDYAAELVKKADGQSMKRFTIPTSFGVIGKYPFHVYVLDRPKNFPYKGIGDQVEWVKQARGGEIPQDVIESFEKLQKIAWENNVSFPDLAAYAIGDSDKKSTGRATKLKEFVIAKDLIGIKEGFEEILQEDGIVAARSTLEDILNFDKSSLVPLFSLASDMYINGEWRTAIDILSELIENTEKQEYSSHLYYWRGMSYQKLDLWSDAENDFLISLTLSPDNSEALNSLGYAWVERDENLSIAVSYLQQAAELEPDNAYIRDSLGWALVRSGNPEAGVSLIESAALDHPQEAEILAHLAETYRLLGRSEEAKKYFNRANSFVKNDKVAEFISRNSKRIPADTGVSISEDEAIIKITSLLDINGADMQYQISVDQTGLAIQGYDSVAYFNEKHAVVGKFIYSVIWMDSIWLFTTAKNKALFVNNPYNYAPQYGGFAANQVPLSIKRHSDPEQWSVHQGKLYLFLSESAKSAWELSTISKILKSDKAWPIIRDEEITPDISTKFTALLLDSRIGNE